MSVIDIGYVDSKQKERKTTEFKQQYYATDEGGGYDEIKIDGWPIDRNEMTVTEAERARGDYFLKPGVWSVHWHIIANVHFIVELEAILAATMEVPSDTIESKDGSRTLE